MSCIIILIGKSNTKKSLYNSIILSEDSIIKDKETIQMKLDEYIMEGKIVIIDNVMIHKFTLQLINSIAEIAAKKHNIPIKYRVVISKL